MFDNLQERFERAFKVLKGHGSITEVNIGDTLKEVRKALLDADVDYKTAKTFVKNVKEKALGKEVLTALKPGQLLIKITQEELTELMGKAAAPFELKAKPSIILLAGLQGAGKTTHAGKLAKYITDKNKKTLDEIIYQKVGFLSNFTNIYVGKQNPNVLRKIKNNLKNNKSNIIFPNSWKLIKKKNQYLYQDKKNKIKLNTKNIHSKGLLENLCHAIKIALDLKIKTKIIEKTIPKISFEGRFQYINKGRIKDKLHKNERIMLDGAHAKADAVNMSGYLKKIKDPKYAIWAMMKNKEPDLFIKQFKGIFKKIITISIENEKNCMSAKDLKSIAKKNHFDVDTADSFDKGLKKISSANKKLIVCLGSLYNIGNILNKNYK